MKITGQILKEQRVRKQITLNEVSIATKINTKVLQAMEEGNLEHLPQKTFLRGFVRSYAKYLQLNVDDILNQFSEEMGTTNPQLPLSEEGSKRGDGSPGENRATPMPNGEGSSTGRLLLVAGAVLLIVVIFIVHRTVEKYERESQKASLPADATTPVDGTALNPAISITGMPDPNATGGPLVTPGLSGTPPATTLTPEASLSGTPTPTKSVSAVVVPMATPTSVPTPTVAAKPTAAPKPTVTPKPSATPKPLPTTKPSPTPKPTATPKPSPSPKASPTPKPTAAPKSTTSEDEEPTPTPRKGSQEVIIESLDNVSIDFTIDGGPTQSIKLKAEQIHTFKAKTQLTLEIANGGAVNLIYNGKDRGVPGTPGKPTKLRFP